MARRILAAVAIVLIVGALLLLALEVHQHRRGPADETTVAFAVRRA